MSQAGAGDLPDMVYTGQVPSATCHVPRVSPPISRATSPPSSPSSAAPPSSPSSSSWSSSSAAEGDSDDDDNDDNDNDRVRAGGAAGTRTTSPTAPSSTTSSRTQSASAPVWRSTSRWGQVTCHVSTVTCDVSGHPPSRWPDGAAGAEPRRPQVCARRHAGAVRHGPARPHQHTVSI